MVMPRFLPSKSFEKSTLGKPLNLGFALLYLKLLQVIQMYEIFHEGSQLFYSEDAIKVPHVESVYLKSFLYVRGTTIGHEEEKQQKLNFYFFCETESYPN